MIRGSYMGLDLSKSAGWGHAYGWAKPTWGVLELPRNSWDKADVPLGRVLRIYRNWLVDMIDVLQPEKVVYEAPIVTGGGDLYKHQVLLGLTAVTEEVCDEGPVVYQESSSTVRKWFIGKGRGTSKELKDAVMDKCRELGWAVTDHNAADALAMLDYLRAGYMDDVIGSHQQILGGARG